MNIKCAIISLAALSGLAGEALAQPMLPFSTWGKVEMHSRDIIVAKCLRTTDDPDSHFAVRGLIPSDMEILTSLKGRTNLGPAKLYSLYWPRPREKYLIFTTYMDEDGLYDAIERYRVIPLGTYVPPGLLTGKTLDGNLHILFQWRLEKLKEQMKENEGELQRLELGMSETMSPPAAQKSP